MSVKFPDRQLWLSRLAGYPALFFLAALASCRPAAPTGPPKIGIMTGTVSQGEDELRGAERLILRYGKERIAHTTYPDDFMSEQETLVNKLRQLAEDPAVGVILVAQAVPGCIKAMKDIRRFRPEMKFILIAPQEDPAQVAEYADLLMVTDDLERGRTIAEAAKRMGAKTLVHYSFPRHLSQELISRRRDLMARTAKDLGIEFVPVNAPDPMGDQKLPGAQKFILEDVPRQVARYGRETAFFSTNCGMQEPLIRAVIESGAFFPEQCCPSPTHGYPGALGIAIAPEIAGDIPKIRAEVGRAVAARRARGRLATWPVSLHIVMIEAAAELAFQALEEGPEGSERSMGWKDLARVKRALDQAAGVPVALRPYRSADGKTELPNFLLALLETVPF
ncbi:MAG: DUF3798 domain-containing protein [Planctomycetes bacterium]|nr:DUF3798 domain-containing protein [Planctomycetota bacterium]